MITNSSPGAAVEHLQPTTVLTTDSTGTAHKPSLDDIYKDEGMYKQNLSAP